MAETLNLTNAEILRQLKSFGVNVGPVTASTRSVYIKKLNSLNLAKKIPGKTSTGNKDSNGRHTTSSKRVRQTKTGSERTLGFSTDESDHEETKRVSSSRRSHVKRKEEVPKFTPSHHRDAGTASQHPTSNSRRVVSTSRTFITNGYSDDSDNDASQGSWVEVTTADTNTSPGLWSSNTQKTLQRRSLHRSSLHTSTTTPKSPDDEDNAYGDNEESAASLNTFANSPKNTNPDRRNVQTETRNGGDFFRRRALSGAMKQTVDTDPNCRLSDNAAGDHLPQGAVASNPGLLSRIMSSFSKKRNQDGARLSSFEQTEATLRKRSWPLQCSFLLPIGTVVFFVVLGLLYVTMRADDAVYREVPSFAKQLPEQDETTVVMEIVNQIYRYLATRTGDNLCNITKQPNSVSVGELRSHLKLGYSDQNLWLKAVTRIKENPAWNIFLFTDSDGTLLEESDSPVDARFMETSQPILPAVCRFQRAVEKVFFRVSVVLCVGFLLWLVIVYRQYRARKTDEERQQTFLIVDKILDVLKKHVESCRDDDGAEPYIPILHVRDMVLSPQERYSMSKVWDKAVRFISASESRVRVETQRVSGEDHRVWRWIQVTSPVKRLQAPARVWQGEAFDTNRSINTPTISPTPCLKIRNMFNPEVEKDADWHEQIQDSILEKCADNNEILSIVVEKKSNEGLVYVKCASCAAAGSAFRSLHGSWFDGRLVTVKFIKLQRFHTRYPQTVDANTPLKPTSDTPVSTFLPQVASPGGFFTSTPLKADS